MEFEKSSDSPILTVRSGTSLIVKFNRPHERNPLSVAALEILHEIMDSLISTATPETEIEKIIFTGSENVFAAGANLREIDGVKKSEAREFAARGQNLMSKISRARQPTIAAVSGFCFGGALDLALACDWRIAAPNAVFSHPGVNLGIITGWGGTQRLPRLVGESAALEMFFTAQRVDAREALRIGLIDAIAENPLAYSLANFSIKPTS